MPLVHIEQQWMTATTAVAPPVYPRDIAGRAYLCLLSFPPIGPSLKRYTPFTVDMHVYPKRASVSGLEMEIHKLVADSSTPEQ